MRAALLAVLTTLAACSESGSHVFAGRLYEAARDCVDPTRSIDVVDGKPPGAPCPRACLVGPGDRDSGASPVFVSTTCAPFPRGFDVSGTGAACALALDAYDRNDTCEADGGTSHPSADAGRTGCREDAGTLFCDDFDRDGDLSVGAWSSAVARNAEYAASTDAAVSRPNSALFATLPVTDGGTAVAYFSKDVGSVRAPKYMRFEADVLLDAPCRAYTMQMKVSDPAVKTDEYFLAFVESSATAAFVQETSVFDGFAAGHVQHAVEPLHLATWTHLRMDATLTAPASLTVWVDGALRSQSKITPQISPSATAHFILGLSPYDPAAPPCRIRYDNVRVDAN